MKKRAIIAILLIIVLAIAGCGNNAANSQETGESNAPKDVIRWRLVTHQLPGTSRYEGTVIPFCEAVEQASGGRLIIEPYGAGVLFPASEALDSVKNGMVEMSASWDGLWAGKNPVFSLAGNIPVDPIKSFGEHFYRVEKLDPILEKAYEEFGVTYLGSFDYGPPEIFMTSKPVNSLEDFKGLNIRAAGMSGDFYSTLGGSVVSLASNEIYTALQLGTIDAAEYNDWIVNMEMGFDEITKYVVEPVLHTGALTDKSLVVNSSAWNALPADLQEIVLSSLNTSRFQSAKVYEVGSNLAKVKYLESGAEIIELSKEDVDKASELAAELIKSYIPKNALCKEYVETYAQVLDELGYKDEAERLK